jgi:hypothetical protein
MYIMINMQDNVFVNVVASVQYRALADKASDAFYKLSNTREQIQSYVFDGKIAVCFELQFTIPLHK